MKKALPLLLACILFAVMSGCTTQPVPDDMFCITALEDGLEVSMELTDGQYTHTTPSLLYSQNGQNWNDFVIGQSVVTLPKTGDKLYMKANECNTAFACPGDSTTRFAANANSFKFSRKAKVSGNIMYLLNGEHPENAVMDDYAFFGLFMRDSLLTDASELLLPAQQLSSGCYVLMFIGTSIDKAPELPATELATDCYSSMFMECRNLTAAPALPATRMDSLCYRAMFHSCSSMTAAPELPATQLAYGCYANMFNGCTSLAEGPELPAEELAPYCYALMFTDCTSLTSLTCLATDISAERCVRGWMKNINTAGTLHAASGTDWTGLIPDTWTVQ